MASLATTATGSRPCPRTSAASASSTSAPSTASTPSSPRPACASGRRGRQRAVQGMGQLALGHRAGGGEGFAAIRELLDSEVDYRWLDAFDLDELAETFDLVLCFGILHRVENRWACSRRFDGASRPADGCCSKPTARPIKLSNPRRRFTFPRQGRSMPVMTSSTGASPRGFGRDRPPCRLRGL